jgi:eukaryotic-like serine/threonine-protein kinase
VPVGISKLGKYTIRRELGKGAMGIVYEGFDPSLERTVAIKTIKPQQKEATEVLARFKREAQSAARLNHPGIVAVYEYGEAVPEDDHTMVASPATVADANRKIAYIVMEFIKGKELRDYFEANERFPLPEVARLMGEVLAALGHAHANGVVHRDIKPANLIVLDDGHVKIADFGVARVEKSELTQAGAVIGTPSYMSPEQFLGQPVDGRSDLFSCGVVLYQFLTGEKPFTGNTTTIMYKVLQEEPLAPSTLNVGLPGAFDAVMRKAIAKSPAERFQTAAEFADAINAATHAAAEPAVSRTESTAINAAVPPLARQASSAPAAPPVPTPASQPVSGPAAASAGPPQPAAAPAKGGSGKLVAGVVAASVAVLGLVGTFLYLGRGTNAPSPVVQGGSGPAPGASTLPPAVPAAAAAPAQEPGFVTISALGLVDPKDPRFKGDAVAAQAEAQADAKRQVVVKALGMYVENQSLNKNYALLEQKMLAQPGAYFKAVLQEGAAATGRDGLVEAETRAVVRTRDLQKSLNQLSKEERIEIIRNNGDPKVAILMTVANAETGQNFLPARSQVAENVIKERIKSFGFRVWSNEGDTATGPNARGADFVIQGEAKLKQLSARLPASGLVVTKTALTSWTVKAIDKTTGEEIYLNTVTPKRQSWATEDEALADIGRQVGEEFSKNFFLQYFNVGVRQTSLDVTGLPDAATAGVLLRELRGVRQVLDVQLVADSGRYRLVLSENSPPDVVQEAIVKPLNAKLGRPCFTVSGTGDNQVSLAFSSACADAASRVRLETTPPAGLLDAPGPHRAPLLKGRLT